MLCFTERKVYICIPKRYIMDYKKLKELRKFRNVSLKELSDMTGINRNTLSSIECGRCNPTINRLEAIARALDLRIIISL